MIAYGYARVSTAEQAAEGLSLDAQEAKIRAYALIHDLQIAEIIREEGASGKNLKRPKLQRLLSLLAGKQREALIVWKLDRLTRSTRDLLHLIEDVFKGSHTRLFSISEQIDTETATGKFFLTIMGAMAQMEREVISERTSFALDLKRQRTEHLGAIPYGYKKDGKLLVKDNEEQKWIRQMQTWRKQGLSYADIAFWLNEHAVPTKRQGASWGPSAVFYILKQNTHTDIIVSRQCTKRRS